MSFVGKTNHSNSSVTPTAPPTFPTPALRSNRKGSDEDILRLNALGLSLESIGRILKCHPTSVTLRLKRLRVSPADTRRGFMEDIFSSLPENFQEVIGNHLMSANPSKPKSIKDYVKELIVADVTVRQVWTELDAAMVEESDPSEGDTLV